eukprot:4829935-Lingulodinium_polyedra.AAC.1
MASPIADTEQGLVVLPSSAPGSSVLVNSSTGEVAKVNISECKLLYSGQGFGYLALQGGSKRWVKEFLQVKMGKVEDKVFIQEK